MEQKFCQSCGMPLTEEILGTNADGSKNEDYCQYCYKDGEFLQQMTMDEMIEHCAQFVDGVNKHLPAPLTREGLFPTPQALASKFESNRGRRGTHCRHG